MTADKIRARLDHMGFARTPLACDLAFDALRAVLDLCDEADRKDWWPRQHEIRRAIADALGVDDA